MGNGYGARRNDAAREGHKGEKEMNQMKRARAILRNQKAIEETPFKQCRALKAYKKELSEKVAVFKEDNSEFFKSFYEAFCFRGNERLKREIIERWDILQDEWKRVQGLKGMSAILYGYYHEDNEDPCVHEWQRKGIIKDFFLPRERDYLGGPRLLFEEIKGQGDKNVHDYWLAETLFKGWSNDVGKYYFTSESGKTLFPSAEHQSSLFAIKEVNRLLY